MANNTSPHILNTSANLLGFCLFVITALHISDKNELSKIDEVTSVIAFLLAISSMLSFVSIKTKNDKWEKRLELISDYLFIISLAGIVFVIFLIARNYIN